MGETIMDILKGCLKADLEKDEVCTEYGLKKGELFFSHRLKPKYALDYLLDKEKPKVEVRDVFSGDLSLVEKEHVVSYSKLTSEQKKAYFSLYMKERTKYQPDSPPVLSPGVPILPPGVPILSKGNIGLIISDESDAIRSQVERMNYDLIKRMVNTESPILFDSFSELTKHVDPLPSFKMPKLKNVPLTSRCKTGRPYLRRVLSQMSVNVPLPPVISKIDDLPVPDTAGINSLLSTQSLDLKDMNFKHTVLESKGEDRYPDWNPWDVNKPSVEAFPILNWDQLGTSAIECKFKENIMESDLSINKVMKVGEVEDVAELDNGSISVRRKSILVENLFTLESVASIDDTGNNRSMIRSAIHAANGLPKVIVRDCDLERIGERCKRFIKMGFVVLVDFYEDDARLDTKSETFAELEAMMVGTVTSPGICTCNFSTQETPLYGQIETEAMYVGDPIKLANGFGVSARQAASGFALDYDGNESFTYDHDISSSYDRGNQEVTQLRNFENREEIKRLHKQAEDSCKKMVYSATRDIVAYSKPKVAESVQDTIKQNALGKAERRRLKRAKVKAKEVLTAELADLGIYPVGHPLRKDDSPIFGI